jgi:hypothetical protein
MTASTSERYAAFAARGAAGNSAIYERLALAVAESDALLERLGRLPEVKRQPNLLFASVRAGAPCGPE